MNKFLLTFALVALSFTSHADLKTEVDSVVSEEIQHRSELRRLVRKMQIAELESQIRKFNGESEASMDLGLGIATSTPMESIATMPEVGPQASEQTNPPVIVGFRNGKGLFKDKNRLYMAGHGESLLGRFKVLSVDTNSAIIQLPNGSQIEQAIAWGLDKATGHNHE